jgi:hypothetical protein
MIDLDNNGIVYLVKEINKLGFQVSFEDKCYDKELVKIGAYGCFDRSLRTVRVYLCSNKIKISTGDAIFILAHELRHMQHTMLPGCEAFKRYYSKNRKYIKGQSDLIDLLRVSIFAEWDCDEYGIKALNKFNKTSHLSKRIYDIKRTSTYRYFNSLGIISPTKIMDDDHILAYIDILKKLEYHSKNRFNKNISIPDRYRSYKIRLKIFSVLDLYRKKASKDRFSIKKLQSTARKVFEDTLSTIK